MLLFLGAGASKAFGIPIMKEFMQLFEAYVKGTEPDGYGEDGELLDDIRTGLGDNKLDLESLMTILEDLSKGPDKIWGTISPFTATFLHYRQRQLGDNYLDRDGVPERCRQLLHRLKALIRKRCIQAIRIQRSEILRAYDDFLGVLGNLPRINRSMRGSPPRGLVVPLRIFTTNYDTCVETYLNERQIDFANGIVPRFGENIFDPQQFTNTSMEVVKLHGSIDLYRQGERIRQIAAFSASLDDAITPLGEDFGEEFLVYPIESSGTHHVFQSPFLDLYNLLRSRLANEQVWVIVGFSFRDLTVASLFNDVLLQRRKEDRPLVVLIDPQETRVIRGIQANGFHTLAEHMTSIAGELGTDSFLQKFKETTFG